MSLSFEAADVHSSLLANIPCVTTIALAESNLSTKLYDKLIVEDNFALRGFVSRTLVQLSRFDTILEGPAAHKTSVLNLDLSLEIFILKNKSTKL